MTGTSFSKKIKEPETMFDTEREVFKSFKQALERNHAIQDELERALEILMADYNTTVYENRFVAGGVCEHVLGAAMRAAGLQVTNVGSLNRRVDLQIEIQMVQSSVVEIQSHRRGFETSTDNCSRDLKLY